MIAQSILDLVGNTPLLAMNRLAPEFELLAKLEIMNPGYSVKDRIGIRLLESLGDLPKGSTILEITSGNTGIGLAIAAKIMGHHCIFILPDRTSEEKINLLRAYGAETIICPCDVKPDHPASQRSVANYLAQQMPHLYMTDQYNNLANPKTHYETTGPEIWKDTDGRVDAFVCGVGTGGTISGVGKYLKDKNSKIKIFGVQPVGEIHTMPEGVHQFDPADVPLALDPNVVDHWLEIHNKEACEMAQNVAQKEALLIGGSSGAAVAAAFKAKDLYPNLRCIVVMIHDSGRSYISKLYNADWLCRHDLIAKGERTALSLELETILRPLENAKLIIE